MVVTITSGPVLPPDRLIIEGRWTQLNAEIELNSPSIIDIRLMTLSVCAFLRCHPDFSQTCSLLDSNPSEKNNKLSSRPPHSSHTPRPTESGRPYVPTI